MLTGITHIGVAVKDMERSKDFYCRVLKLKPAFEINEPGAPWIVFIHIGKTQFVELFNGTKEHPWERGMRGFSHLCLEVDDIHEFIKHVEAEGCKLDRELCLGADKNWQCWVTDPDGLRIEVMQISPDSPEARAIAALL